MNEPTSRADEWIRNTLKADTTLTALLGGSANPRLYADVAPQGSTAFPVCIWQLQGAGPDVRPNGRDFVYANLLFLVKAIDKGGSYPQAVADRVMTLLDNQSGTATGGTIIYCRREMPWRVTDVDTSGVMFKSVGATFRVWVGA